MTKFWTSSKFKAFTDYRIVNQKLTSVKENVENIVGKGENAGYQHFLLFPEGHSKSGMCGIELNGDFWHVLKTFYSRSFKPEIVW